jgi:MYXO-CTERM domain-containing protein
VGGYLWQGAADPSAFTSALSLAGNDVPTICQSAGLRALGASDTPQTCPTAPYEQAAACAAGEGLRNNDGPVTSVLVPNAGQSSGSNQTILFYAHMLKMVRGVRRAAGGPMPLANEAGTGDLQADQPKVDQSVDQPKVDLQSVDQPKVDQAKVDQANVDQPKVDQPKVDQAKPADLKKDQVPKKDQYVPKKDQYVPKKDQYVPKKDQYVPKKDTTPQPGLEPGQPQLDTSGPAPESGVGNEAGLPGLEPSGPRREAGTNNASRLEGGCGCAVAEHSPTAPLFLAALVLVIMLTRRRRRRLR